MNKKEFLKGLEEALLEYMDISEAAPHIRYYQDYIDNEIKNGKDECDVVKALNSPRLIAKNIVNNSESANKYSSDVNDEYESYRMNNQYQGKHGDNKSPISFSINGKPINSLFLKIALIALVFVIIILALVVLGGIIWIFTKLVLPVLLIGGAVYIIVKLIKNNM